MVKQVFKPYLMKQAELSLENGCLLWGTRVVVTSKFRAHVLEDLREAHPGIT